MSDSWYKLCLSQYSYSSKELLIKLASKHFNDVIETSSSFDTANCAIYQDRHADRVHVD